MGNSELVIIFEQKIMTENASYMVSKVKEKYETNICFLLAFVHVFDIHTDC